jgi:hypothetical protein
MANPHRAVSHAVVREYLLAVRQYAGDLRLPGFDISSAPLSLEDIFIEPRLESLDKAPQAEDGKAEHDRPNALGGPNAPVPEPASAIPTREQSLALLAEPGRGKSTLLRQYAWKLAVDGDRGRLPILVEFGRKPDRTADSDLEFAWLYERLPELIRKTLGKRGWGVLCSVINNGGASILLDAFDELNQPARRQVSELVPALKRNQVVLTSRPREYRLMPFAGFKQFDLLKLTSQQAANFAQNAVAALARQYGGIDYRVPLQNLLQISRGAAQSMLRNPCCCRSCASPQSIDTPRTAARVSLPVRCR